MATLSSVLKQLIAEEADLNVTELARLTGIVQPVVHRLVNGDTDNPKIHTITPIADHFGITLDELVGRTLLPAQNALANRFKRQQLPIIEWAEIANWLERDFETKADLIETDMAVSKKAYALITKDSTMSPRFMANTILIIDPSITPENGDFVVATSATSTQPTFKQVLFDGDDIYLKPLNPDFKTLYFNKHSKPHFLGVVVEARMKLREIQTEKHK